MMGVWNLVLGRVLLPFLLIFALGITATLPGQEFADIAAIKARGKLVVGLTANDNVPFFSLNRQGKLEGTDIELAEEIADILGVEVEFVRTAKSFDDLISQVSRGEVDLATSKISRTPARTMLVEFSKPYVKLRHALLFSRLRLARDESDPSLENYVRHFHGDLAVIANSAYEYYAHEYFPEAHIVPMNSWAEMVDAVRKGEVTAAYRDEFEVRRVIAAIPDAVLSMRAVILSDLHSELVVAINPATPHMKALVDAVIDAKPEPLTAETLLVRAEGEKNAH